MFEGIDRMDVWRWVSSLILAVLLFMPAKRLIFVQKVRRAEAKLKRRLNEDERKELERKTIPVTAFIVILFSFLFNSMIMSKYFRFK